jgi:hypothetical protein
VPYDGDGTTLVVTDWHFVGREHALSLPLAGGAA